MKRVQQKVIAIAKRVETQQNDPFAIGLASSIGLTLAVLLFMLDSMVGAATGADSAGIVRAALGAIIAIAAFHWSKRQ